MLIPDMSPAAYHRQLTDKISLTRSQFAPFAAPEFAVFPSPAQYYRMRAEFSLWHPGKNGADTGLQYAMFEGKTPRFLSQFPVASTTINRLMPALREGLMANPLLLERVFQCEFLSSRLDQAVITLAYHKPLCDTWDAAAQQLADKLGVGIVGRARKQKRVIGRQSVDEAFWIQGRRYEYEHQEASFTQPNAEVCEAMLNWAVEALTGIGGDLLELYCGNGNFTVPLARLFDRVLATEIAQSGVASALGNLARNQVTNVALARLSSEELTQALAGVRPFRRLAHIDLAQYRFSSLLVDPPRAGLDPATLALASRFQHLVYISCNPDTLIRDLGELRKTHRIAKAALFDQFPFTHHRECGLLLVRNAH